MQRQFELTAIIVTLDGQSIYTPSTNPFSKREQTRRDAESSPTQQLKALGGTSLQAP